MSKSNDAWLIPVDGERLIAVANHEMIEYVVAPQLHQVPRAPGHCAQVMFWRQHIIPMMDLSVVLGKGSDASSSESSVVLAYQQAPGRPLNYLGLTVQGPPIRVSVEDDQACDTQTVDEQSWLSAELVLAWFVHEKQPVPVIDIAYLCSAAYRKAVTTVADEEEQHEVLLSNHVSGAVETGY